MHFCFPVVSTFFFLYIAIKAPEDVMKSYMQLIGHIEEYAPVQLEDLEKVCSLSHVIVTTKGSVKTERHIQEVLAGYVQQILTSPVISLLDVEAVWKERDLAEEKGDGWKYPTRDFAAMVKHFRATQGSEVHTIYAFTNVHTLLMYNQAVIARYNLH